MSRLERHRQTLESEIHRYQACMVMELLEQGYAFQAMELLAELRYFKQLGVAYWRIESQVIP